MAQKLPKFLEMVESKIPSRCIDLVRGSLKPTEELLRGTKDKISDCIVNELFEYFDIQLKQVSDIPRLYRKTNRSIPTKPCNYIDVIGKSLKEFSEDASKTLDNSYLIQLYNMLFNVMSVS